MIFLLNFTPSHCPRCGHGFKAWDAMSRQDFFGGCSHTCPGCGAHFAYVDGPKLLEAAAVEGDMGSYVSAEDVR